MEHWSIGVMQIVLVAPVRRSTFFRCLAAASLQYSTTPLLHISVTLLRLLASVVSLFRSIEPGVVRPDSSLVKL